MKQLTYIFINFLIIIVPLALSFEQKINFHKKWNRVFLSILFVMLVFIPWDIWATWRGHWEFNENFITGLKLGNLPIEEVLFFITVPYSCLFLYEVVKYYFKERSLKFDLNENFIKIFIGMGLTIFGVLNRFNGYTSIVAIVVGISVIMLIPSGFSIFKSRRNSIWFTICIILFITFNSILAGLPVVLYGRRFILGIRIGAIPIEDFVYNWLLLTLSLFVYERAERLKISIM